MFYFVYGPPASGKSSLARLLAERLGLPLVDLDAVISAAAGKPIPEIFAEEGETGFRQRESALLKQVLANTPGVIALGGGALLDSANRELVEAHGTVLCLSARLNTLLARLARDQSHRPLIAGKTVERLASLLARRADHYASFPLQCPVDDLSPEQVLRQAQILLGCFRISGMGAPYDLRVVAGGLQHLPDQLARLELRPPLALVTDDNLVASLADPLLARLSTAGYPVKLIRFPPGESQKNSANLIALWSTFVQAGLERRSTVLALGGGVIGDLTGFAAATYQRGVPWVNLPTTLLAMVDASLGGKTAVDLPEGKNLAGAFHPPRLVLTDPDALSSLPLAEVRAGLAEVVKHGILADPGLFDLCSQGLAALQADWSGVVSRAIAVKVDYIEADPYESGLRAALNLGHTVGHAVEKASNFRLRHGEAVAIGLVAEARLAEQIGLAEPGLADQIAACLLAVGLPVTVPAWLDRQAAAQALQVDKKRQSGQVLFALPAQLGAVTTGIPIPNAATLLGWDN